MSQVSLGMIRFFRDLDSFLVNLVSLKMDILEFVKLSYEPSRVQMSSEGAVLEAVGYIVSEGVATRALALARFYTYNACARSLAQSTRLQ